MMTSKYLLFIGETPVLYGKKETRNNKIIYEIIPEENLVIFHSIIPIKIHKL